MNHPSNTPIGIDFGTSNLCVGIMRDGSTEIIANDQGHRNTPALVAFTDEEMLLDSAAVAQSHKNPRNTIYDPKRLLGQQFSSPEFQAELKKRNFPFKIISSGDDDDEPVVEVEFKEKKTRFTITEICGFLLKKMRDTAEAYVGGSCLDTVITVPAFFNSRQRDAMRKAGALAGLNVMRIINDSTAAALAYGIDEPNHKETKQEEEERQTSSQAEEYVVVYDLGGGYLDVSIYTVSQGILSLLSHSSDGDVGGASFDDVLIKYFSREFKRKTKLDLTESSRAMVKLRIACERCRRTLSRAPRANIEIDSLYEGIDLFSKITRARFEGEAAGLFNRCLAPLRDMLQNLDIDQSNISKVIMVGGATAMPKLVSTVKSFFENRIEPLIDITADEAVAGGAALQASLLFDYYTSKRARAERKAKKNGKKKKKKKKSNGKTQPAVPIGEVDTFITVPLAAVRENLGIACLGGSFRVIVQAMSQLPISASINVSTAMIDQKSALIQVYEGPNTSSIEDRHILLGEIHLPGITADDSAPDIEVKFSLDATGFLTVFAKSGNDGKTVENQLQVPVSSQQAEIDTEIKSGASDYIKEASVHRLLVSYVAGIQHSLAKKKDLLSDADSQLLQQSVKVASDYVASLLKAEQNKDETEKATSVLKELDDKVGSILKKLDESDRKQYAVDSDQDEDEDEDEWEEYDEDEDEDEDDISASPGAKNMKYGEDDLD